MEKKLTGGNPPPLASIQGTVRHIQWTPREIDAYIACLEKVTRRYVQRLQWLLSGEPACRPGGGGARGGAEVSPGSPEPATHELSGWGVGLPGRGCI